MSEHPGVSCLYPGSDGAPALAVCAAAACNGLAFSAYQTWAFRRAELTAFAESPFRDHDGERLTMGHVRSLAPTMPGPERLVAIASQLIADVASQLERMPSGVVVPLFVCLPERLAEGLDPRVDRARTQLSEALLARFAESSCVVAPTLFALGRASLARALLEVARGRHTLAFVLGLDTWFDGAVVDQLLNARRLFDGKNLDSFIPGEGGALLLVASPDAARAHGAEPLALIEGIALAQEPATRDNGAPNAGVGLSSAAVAALARLRSAGRALDWWLADMTNEHFSVQEFQLAWPRAAAGTMRPESALDFLAVHLGDLGAAAMPTAIAIAIEGFSRGHPRARTAVTTGCSDGGARGAVLIAAGAQQPIT